MTTQSRPPSSSHDAETTPVASRPVSSSIEGISAILKQEEIPERIGGYRILRVIGSGGMGIVYLAQRDEGRFSQRVALKIIKKGMDSDEILRRFELERQLLSGLNHPNIARLVDGGTTDDGRPYFALEYVEGQPLDKYCDTTKLSTRDRLNLFRKVCAAVHYAHQNLIVHRDLKPGNVLVTPEGEPKLLDFGIAKLLNPSLFQAIAVTGPAVRLMTPEYASPEQVKGDSITTASDIYSLGVMLYELLTGRRPYRFKTRMQQEIARIICEETPQRPSTVISRVDEEPVGEGKTRRVDPTTVAQTREGDIDKLRRRLKGDIDDIVMKALDKTPTRRYTSAEQLAEDIQRHLEGVPVIARPPSVGYRFAKFVQRNRGSVGAAAAVFLALSAGVVATSLMWGRAEQARAEANVQRVLAQDNAEKEQQQRVAADAARQDAEAQKARAESAYKDLETLSIKLVSSFQAAIVKLPASVELRQEFATVGAQYLEKLSGLAGDQDKGRLLDLSAAYERLGQVQADIRSGNKGSAAKALELHRRSLELRQGLLAADPANRDYLLATATSHIRVGDLLSVMGDSSGSEENYRSAVSLLEKIDGDTKAEAPARTRLAAAVAKVGEALQSQGKLDAARAEHARADALRRKLLELDPTAQARRNVTVGEIDQANLLIELGQNDAALRLFQTAVDTRRALLAEEPTTARAQRDLAVALFESSRARLRAGDHAASLRDATESREIMSKLTAQEKDSPDARNLWTLAVTSVRAGDALLAGGDAADSREAALRAYDASVQLLNARVASDPDNADFKNDLIQALSGQGACLTLLGKPLDALAPLNRSVQLGNDRVEPAPNDIPARRRLALDMRRLANAHLAAASAPGLAPDQQANHQASARDALTRALDHAAAVATTQLRALAPDAEPAAIKKALESLPPANPQ